MKLTFRGSDEPRHYPQYHRYVTETPDELWKPLLIGTAYDVAEIFEMPGFLMVRPVGAAGWPPPASPWFGWPPELFEPTAEPIPIVSCGFYFNETLTEFFGVLLSGKELTGVIEELRAIKPPDDDEEMDDWHTRAIADAPHHVAQALFNLLSLPVASDFGVCHQIYVADTRLRPPIAYAGCYLADLARNDVTAADYAECLDVLLTALEIRNYVIEEINLPYWQGTAGGARLINAPPDGRLVYGTAGEPVELPDLLANRRSEDAP